jgi:hypothetical protein
MPLLCEAAVRSVCARVRTGASTENVFSQTGGAVLRRLTGRNASRCVGFAPRFAVAGTVASGNVTG